MNDIELGSSVIKVAIDRVIAETIDFTVSNISAQNEDRAFKPAKKISPK